MKVALGFIIGLIVVWIGLILIQKTKRVPVARDIWKETIRELWFKGFDNLVSMIGKGYQSYVKEVDGVNYYIGYVVTRSRTIPPRHSKDDSEILSKVHPGEQIDEVEVKGYVDCISILPVVYFKAGPGFGYIINRNDMEDPDTSFEQFISKPRVPQHHRYT